MSVTQHDLFIWLIYLSVSMENLPRPINRDILTYGLPLFLMSLTRLEADNKYYWMAIPGCIFARVPFTSKTKLIISAVLYLVQVVFPDLYFLALGFILHQAYNSNILMSKKPVVCNFLTKMEILGFLCSTVVSVPVVLRLCLGVAALSVVAMSAPPSVEAPDPFESMKAKIPSSKMLNIEYRYFLGQGREEEQTDMRVFWTEIFVMISHRKVLLLFCSFFSLARFDLVVVAMGILFIFGYCWEFLSLILKANAAPNVIFRVVTTYVIYLLLDLTTKMLMG